MVTGRAALQILYHRQLHQRPRLDHQLLLRQPRAQRCAAGYGPQPADAADQSARSSREGEQDPADVRAARWWLDRMARRAEGARLSHMKKLEDMGDRGAPAAKRSLMRDCAALSLLSLIPPDRVGCIRKLRFGHTLKRKPSGGWAIDLSKQRDGHKTSRFYGPFAASLPTALTPILDKYEQMFKFEVGGDEAYLFHPPQSGFDRPMESSSWSQWVSRLFQRHAGVAIAAATVVCCSIMAGWQLVPGWQKVSCV